MSSDELKVPSQRADQVEEDNRVRDRDRANDDDKLVHEGDAYPRTDLGGHEDPARSGSLADSDDDDDDEYARGERAAGEFTPGEQTGNDDEPGRRSPRADDEYAAAVPGAVTTPEEEDAAYRDPYARTGGDMLAESQPDPAHTPAVSDEIPAHAAPQEVVLFDQDPTEVQARWRELQASFVDDPGESVQRADGLVSEVVESLTSTLTSRTDALRDRWKSAEGSDTEELRQALRDYRSVLEHLLALSSKSPHQFQNDGSR